MCEVRFEFDQVVPDVIVDLFDGLWLVAARVTHQNVDSAEGMDGRFGQPLHVVAARHVGDDRGHAGFQPVANVGRGRVEIVLVPGGNDDIGTCFGKAASDCLADSFAAAGDQRNAAFRLKRGVGIVCTSGFSLAGSSMRSV